MLAESDNQLVLCNTAAELEELIVWLTDPRIRPRPPMWLPDGHLCGELVEGMLGVTAPKTLEEEGYENWLMFEIRSFPQLQKYPLVVEYGCAPCPGFDFHTTFILHPIEDLPTVANLKKPE